MYVFQFFNSYFSSFWFAFVVNQFATVTLNLIFILAIKQIGMNILEWL